MGLTDEELEKLVLYIISGIQFGLARRMEIQKWRKATTDRCDKSHSPYILHSTIGKGERTLEKVVKIFFRQTQDLK